MSTLERAIRLINDFCLKEYDSEADISDLSKVDLAYTVLEDNDECEIQVSANLVDFGLYTYVDGKLYSETKYDSLEDLVHSELEMLDFDTLVSLND